MNATDESTPDQRFDFSDDVYFLPWIGDNYGAQSRWGKPVLIVGESHYSSEEKGRQFTRNCVQKHIDGWDKSFWTNIRYCLGNREISRNDFWHSVAFYNYVQEIVEGHKDRPTAEMWETAKKPFQDVVAQLRPQCIVVLGKTTTWKHLPTPDRKVKKRLEANGESSPLAYYGNALAGRIHHPSRGFSSRRWRPLVHRLIAEAGNTDES